MGAIVPWLPVVGLIVEGVGVLVVTLDVLPEFITFRGRKRLGALARKLSSFVQAGQDALRTPADPPYGYSTALVAQYDVDQAVKYLEAAPGLNLEALQRDLTGVEWALYPLRWPRRSPADLKGIFKRFQTATWDLEIDDAVPRTSRPPLVLGFLALIVGFVLQLVGAWPMGAAG